MLDRDRIVQLIDAAYEARRRGDKAAISAVFAPGASFRIVSEPGAFPAHLVGPAEAATAIAALIDIFEFHAVERLDTVVEDGAGAVRLRVTVSNGGRPPFTTELFDLWKFRNDGKAISLTQFTDTALVAKAFG